MQDKKKKTKKAVKVGDLKPAKDPKGGVCPKVILKTLTRF
jgi:hypothetical protein